MVHQLTKFHVQRVDMVINPPWNLPFLGAKGLTSPEQTATVEMVFSRPWTCTFLVAKGLATPELMANCVTEGVALEGVIRFGKKGKLAPRYVGPFEILERIGPVAYRLRLPEELSSVHETFHVSNLKKCLADENLHVPLDEIKIDKTLHFVEEPVEIMDCEVKCLKRSKIPILKIRWNSKHGPEFMWERDDHMKAKYP
ncbi:hypothetical protein Tco_0150714 [Tanacetum coccineum]